MISCGAADIRTRNLLKNSRNDENDIGRADTSHCKKYIFVTILNVRKKIKVREIHAGKSASSCFLEGSFLISFSEFTL
jgi:hypothetical protein